MKLFKRRDFKRAARIGMFRQDRDLAPCEEYLLRFNIEREILVEDDTENLTIELSKLKLYTDTKHID